MKSPPTSSDPPREGSARTLADPLSPPPNEKVAEEIQSNMNFDAFVALQVGQEQAPHSKQQVDAVETPSVTTDRPAIVPAINSRFAAPHSVELKVQQENQETTPHVLSVSENTGVGLVAEMNTNWDAQSPPESRIDAPDYLELEHRMDASQKDNDVPVPSNSYYSHALSDEQALLAEELDSSQGLKSPSEISAIAYPPIYSTMLDSSRRYVPDMEVEGYLTNGEAANLQLIRRRLTDTTDSQRLTSSSPQRNVAHEQSMIQIARQENLVLPVQDTILTESQHPWNLERNLPYGTQQQAYPNDPKHPHASHQLSRLPGQTLQSDYSGQQPAGSKSYDQGLLDEPKRTGHAKQQSSTRNTQQQPIYNPSYEQKGQNIHQQALSGTGYQQQASPGTGYQQQPLSSYQQQASTGTDYQQQALTGTGYQQQASTGTGYQQQATTGTGYQQQPSTGTGYQQQPLPGTGTSYQQQASTGTGYQQQSLPGTGYQQQPSTGTGYQQQPSPGTGYQQQASTGTGYQQQSSTGTGYQQQAPDLSYEQLGQNVQSGMGGQSKNLGDAFQSTYQPDRHQGSNIQARDQSNDSSLPIQQQKLDQPLIVQQTQDSARHDHEQQIPTHIRICQVVLGQEIAPFMVEHKKCVDEFDPSLPLAEIFLSAYLAHHARLHGFRVEYDHNCGGHRNDHRLIQELLPSPLTVPGSTKNDMTKAHLQGLCKMMVPNEQNRRESTALEILLWDTSSPMGQRFLAVTAEKDRVLQNPTEGTPIAMLERLVPIVFSNMYPATMQSRLVKTALLAGYGVLKGRNVSSEHLAIGTAVVYLPCRDRDCEDLAVIPYTSYLLHLPLSVHVVDVVVSARCVERLPGCRRYVDDLASTIRQFSPKMSVEVITAEPSSPDVMARLIEAEHVLCGPGFGMVCLFPALARASGRMTLFDIGSDQIDGESASSFVSRLPQDLIKHVTPPTSIFSVTFLSDFGGRETAMTTFAQLPPNKDAGDCRFFRGRVGQWNQDMAYAQHAQYRTPLSHYSGNAEKVFRRKVAKGEYPNLQFRPSTTYRFDEARYQTCAVEQTTQEGVCAMLKSLGVRRIFILGDSLNLQLAQSMWMWLTNEKHGDSPTVKGSLDPNFKTTLQCLGYGSYTLQFIRNDELLENDQPVSIDQNQKNCQTYCYPWTKAYQEDMSRTIMIFNVGAHLHEFERYQSAIDRFVDVFDGMNRPNDVVLFRTLVPGHWDCSRPGLRPFPNFGAYQKDAEEHPNLKEEIYTWSKFSAYNDYTIRKLDYRRFEASTTTKALMEVVDVLPMTVLRPDGHCSDEFRPPSYLDSDCLHYDLPGPVDWWSHLSLSHLKDIATAENYLAQQTPKQ